MKSTVERAPLLHVENLSAGYGGMPALHEASFDIYPAEIVALVGSNGAGKTTLPRALSRVVAGTGRIAFDGRELAELTPDQVFGLGLVQVPEGAAALRSHDHPGQSADGGLSTPRHCGRGVRDLDRMYAMFPRLSEPTHQLAGSMSGGERQMCAMARALMAAPRLMMVDEMSLGLAPVGLVEQDVQLV